MAYDENDPRRLDQPIPPEMVRSDSTSWIIGIAPGRDQITGPCHRLNSGVQIEAVVDRHRVSL